MRRPARPSLSTGVALALAPLRARWRALSPRERHLASLAASAVGILLVWAIALAPAMRSLQKTQVRRTVLDGQLQQMLALQAEARQLAAQPRIGRDVALRALQESVTGLGGGAQMQVSGDRAIVNLRGVPAASVAAWIGQARTDARVVPFEVRLVRSPVRASAGIGAATGAVTMPGMPMPGVPPGVYPGTMPGMPPNVAPGMPYVGTGGVPSAATPAPAGRVDDVRWDGTVVLILPAG